MWIDFLEKHLLRCPSRALLNIECPGCGMQRSFIYLLRGDVGSSLMLHPATIPMIFLLGFTSLHLLFRFKNGAKVIVITQLLVAIITLSFYIYKVFHKLI